MLLRIALAVAILAGIGATVLNLVKVKPEVTRIIGEREDFKNKYQTTQAELGKTQKELTQTKASLDQTKKQLDTTKTERDTAVADADKQRKEVARLKDQVEKATSDKVEAQRDLAAWKALGFSVDQIKVVITDLRQAQKDLGALTNQVGDLGHELAEVKNRLLKYENPSYVVHEPNVAARVVAVDPKFDFVVLDVGQDKGMLRDGDMLVSREGKLVAKVRIRTVDRNTCVANVLPGWKFSELMEGDAAVPEMPKL